MLVYSNVRIQAGETHLVAGQDGKEKPFVTEHTALKCVFRIADESFATDRYSSLHNSIVVLLLYRAGKPLCCLLSFVVNKKCWAPVEAPSTLYDTVGIPSLCLKTF